MNEFSFDDYPNTMCFTCEHILNKEKQILHISHDAHYGTWQFLCGDTHEISNGKIVSLQEIFNIDNTVSQVSNLKLGSKADRQNNNENWSITESLLDYENLTIINYNDIVEITKKGILYKSSFGNKLINFKECCNNYAAENNLEKSNCVAVRNITGSNPSFDFYTNPITKLLFIKEYRLKEFFKRNNTFTLFHKLQNQIRSFGYTPYDLS